MTDLAKLQHMAAFPPPGEAKKRRTLLTDTVHAHLAKAVQRNRAARLTVEGRV